MTTVTTEETVALEAAVPAQNMLLVPLSQLRARPSKRNVRRKRRTSIEALAASYAKDAVMRSIDSSGTFNGPTRSNSFALLERYRASSQASSSGLRRHRGGLPGRVEGSTLSRASRFVSMFARA